MPTDSEVTAAAIALHDMLGDDHTMRGCLHMAGKALAAAEVVRHAALQQAQRDAHAAMNAAMTEAKAQALRDYERWSFEQPSDQRMTQTHAPLASYVEWSQPGDPENYDHTAKAWQDDPAGLDAMTEAELLAGLEPYTKDCGCQVCRDNYHKAQGVQHTLTEADIQRAIDQEPKPLAWTDHPQPLPPIAGAMTEQVAPTSATHSAIREVVDPSLFKDNLYSNLRTTSGPQAADTQPSRQDYHGSGVPGDGIGNAEGIDTDCQRHLTIEGTYCRRCGQRTSAWSPIMPPCPLAPPTKP